MIDKINNKLEHKHYWWVYNTLFRHYTSEQLLTAFEKINISINQAQVNKEKLPWENDTELERKHYWWIRETLFKHYEYDTLINVLNYIAKIKGSK